MVQGVKLNEITVGGVTVSVWRAYASAPDPPPGHHYNVKVDVGTIGDDDWVCIGGGGRGWVPSNYLGGQILTASFPSEDFKSWNVSSRDHIHPDPTPLVGFAIGMKIPGLSKDELRSNLEIFKEDGASEPHPIVPGNQSGISCFVGGEFSLLVGGGFHVLDQQPGNLGTGSFPDSTISWRASSKDHGILSPSRIRVFAIGIRPTIKKADGSVFGHVVTTFHSFGQLPGLAHSTSTVGPLKDFALCGGGASSHYCMAKGKYLYQLEPTQDPNPTPNLQSFTGSVKYIPYDDDDSACTAFAMGIKFVPVEGTPPPPPPCDKRLAVTEVTSSGHLTSFVPTNVNDSNPATKWRSTNIVNPYITLLLREPKPVCRVDISWGDATTRYAIDISTSLDGTNFTSVFSGARIDPSSTLPEPYTFPDAQGRYVKITIKQTTSLSAQISEIAVLSKGVP